MIRILPAAVVLSLLLTVPGLAADKKSKTSSALPPKSSKIAIPPVDPSSTGSEPPKLISSEMSGRDLEFFTAAVNAGRLQAFLVGLLKTKAENPQIKQLADALDSTQEKENKQISRLAALKGWNVSTEPTAEQKKVGGDLEALTGSNFDKAAMDKIAVVNQQAVDTYKAAAQSTDPDIKAFSDQMLPLAEDKLRLVEKMTGAGSKTANRLFRTVMPPKEDAPAATATPEPKPAATPKTKPVKATPTPKPPKATPTPKPPKATPTPTPEKATPAPSPAATATPAGTPSATPANGKPVPTPKPQASASLKTVIGATVPPVSTPPGFSSTPAPILPPILPHKVAVPVATPVAQ